jgi:hypothetical protein
MNHIPHPERAAERASAQHVRAFLISPGQYRVHSKSSRDWHLVSAAVIPGRGVRVVCSCKGGSFYRDAHGSSCCKHGAAVAKRLLRQRRELLAVKFPRGRAA